MDFFAIDVIDDGDSNLATALDQYIPDREGQTIS